MGKPVDISSTLLQTMHAILEKYMLKATDTTSRVIDFLPPEELRQKIDFSLSSEPSHGTELQKIVEDILTYSVSTQHSRFFNQLFARADVYSILAEHIVSVLNPSMYTYEMAPVFTLMEKEVFSQIATRIGWSEMFDGLMLPGGAQGNMYAIHVARYKKFPNMINEGLLGTQKGVVFTSDQSHYSIEKSVMLLGMGKNAVKKIATDEKGSMIPDQLEKSIKQSIQDGLVPLMINATAGTTVFGSFDPLEEISIIGKKYGIHVHVDGARGGAIIFHGLGKQLLKGLDQVDSFTFNPHKMLGANLQTTITMFKDGTALKKCNVLKADYLFHTHPQEEFDTGDKYIQCGRKADVFKFRLIRKMRGSEWFSFRIQKAIMNTSLLVQKIQSSKNLYLYKNPVYTNVCFRYIPDSLLSQMPHAGSYQDAHRQDNIDRICSQKEHIDSLVPAIKQKMMQQGKMMVGYAKDIDTPLFFRMVLISPEVTELDVSFVVDHIQELGESL